MGLVMRIWAPQGQKIHHNFSASKARSDQRTILQIFVIYHLVMHSGFRRIMTVTPGSGFLLTTGSMTDALSCGLHRIKGACVSDCYYRQAEMVLSVPRLVSDGIGNPRNVYLARYLACVQHQHAVCTPPRLVQEVKGEQNNTFHMQRSIDLNRMCIRFVRRTVGRLDRSVTTASSRVIPSCHRRPYMRNFSPWNLRTFQEKSLLGALLRLKNDTKFSSRWHGCSGPGAAAQDPIGRVADADSRHDQDLHEAAVSITNRSRHLTT